MTSACKQKVLVNQPLSGRGPARRELNPVHHEHHDHEIRRERSRTTQIETGLPFVVVVTLIVAIVDSHGVVFYAR